MKYRENPSEPWKEYYIKALDSMVIGSIIQFVGTTIPTGWLVCDGSTITQSAYPELYDLIGGTLPDFRGRVLVGQDSNDTDFDTLLETGGSKELQAHTHEIRRDYNQNGFATPYGEPFSGWGIRQDGIGSATLTKTQETGTGNSGNLQPYAVVKHIIKATNTTPTMASVVNATNSSTTDAYSCDYVNNLVDYSTTEIKTGAKWIDGKPIYRKVIVINNPSGSTQHGISNLGTVISATGNATLSNGLQQYIPRALTGWDINVGDIGGSSFDLQKDSNYSGSYAIATARIVLEYTKTTD